MFLVLVILLTLSSNLHADLLELKNGDTLEGNFLGDLGKFIEFEEKGTIKKIPKDKIKNLELGYRGTSFCYKMVTGEENCDAKLFAVDDKKIIISKGKGSTIKEEIPLTQLEYFKSSNIQKGDRISSIVKPKSKLQIKSKKGELKGSISDSDFKKGSLKVDTDKEGVVLEDSEIEEIYWKREKSKFSWKELAQAAIPGVYQWPRSRILGGSMFLFLVGFGAMIPIEFNKAQQALDESQTVLIVNNRILILNGVGPNSQFEQHRKNMNIGIAGAALIFSYHIYDVVTTKNKEPQDLETKVEFLFTPMLPVERQNHFHTSSFWFESKYSFQITKQF